MDNDAHTADAGIDPLEKAAPDGSAPVTGTLGPATRVTQVMNNVACTYQNGGQPIATGSLNVQGGKIYAFFTASGWSRSGDTGLQANLRIGESSPFTARVFANPDLTHLAMIRQRVFLDNLRPDPSASAKITAGKETVTDTNDHVSLTVFELGSPAVWRRVCRKVGPPDSSSQYVSTSFRSRGGYLLVCASATGFSTSAQAMTGMVLCIDETCHGTIQIFANKKNWHLAFVPADFLIKNIPPGDHTLVATPADGTTIDSNDAYAITIFEVMAPPTVLNVTEVLANAPAAGQTGGKRVASGGFSSYGGTLVITSAASAYSHDGAAKLGMTIQVDSQEVGSMQAFANPQGLHLGLPGNDLVVTGINAGKHTVSLEADAGTATDSNDRCSVTIIEVATSTWP
ncbi:hypothetical protein ACIOC2_25390 [Streptomyces sp. NPDC088337]|uniref:hypothetical protein n=1 Tax=unclassified Streptomyces TaxID=2593676 RepID=UPI002DDA7AE5|nr:hypothetical protein [Streptomyces sp. NBC_01788]WSB30076.1 hypothetical protein OIE49_31630 [Streptomyces sp. NBC_01788]